jgi:hypothetical protein
VKYRYLDLVTIYRTLVRTAQDCFRKVTKFSFLLGRIGKFCEELKLHETVNPENFASGPRGFSLRYTVTTLKCRLYTTKIAEAAFLSSFPDEGEIQVCHARVGQRQSDPKAEG